MIYLDPNHVAWQRNLLNSLSIGGVWGTKAEPCFVTKISENSVTLDGPPSELKIAMIQHIRAAGYTIQGIPDSSLN